MKYPKKYTFDSTYNYLLKQAITKYMQRRWEESMFMAPRIKTDDHYWSEEIDALADMLLEINRA